MNVTATAGGERAVIEVKDRFDFNVHREFREAMASALALPGVKEVVVDLAAASYLDSSALGMLLVMRNKAESLGKRVIIARAGGAVKQVLDIANFKTLFPFE